MQTDFLKKEGVEIQVHYWHGFSFDSAATKNSNGQYRRLRHSTLFCYSCPHMAYLLCSFLFTWTRHPNSTALQNARKMGIKSEEFIVTDSTIELRQCNQRQIFALHAPFHEPYTPISYQLVPTLLQNPLFFKEVDINANRWQENWSLCHSQSVQFVNLILRYNTLQFKVVQYKLSNCAAL